jgi:uncharacterized protein (TIGR03435 family)
MIKRAGRKLCFIGKLLLAVATLRASMLCAQTSAPQPSAAAPAAVSPAVAPLAFEVSTVRQNKSGGPGSSSNMRDGRFTASNTTLKNVLQYQAYGVPESRILGGPPWIGSQRFDIEAKTDSTTLDRIRTLAHDQRRIETRAMFQQLLADRFKLAAHWETRDLPVYALVVQKKGPSLHPAEQPEGHSGTSSNDGRFTAQGLTLTQLADALTQELSRELGRVVIDKTGIPGRYDFALNWTPDTGALAINNGTDASTPQPDTGPSIFTAIQEQLGLKLESSRGPVQVLVIDHAEMPTEN